MAAIFDITTLVRAVTPSVSMEIMPENIPNVVGIFLNGGSSQHVLGAKASAFDEVGFQLRIRHSHLDKAYEWIDRLKDALDGVIASTINSDVYIHILLENGPNNMGVDKRGLFEFSLNFKILVKR